MGEIKKKIFNINIEHLFFFPQAKLMANIFSNLKKKISEANHLFKSVDPTHKPQVAKPIF